MESQESNPNQDQEEDKGEGSEKERHKDETELQKNGERNKFSEKKMGKGTALSDEKDKKDFDSDDDDDYSHSEEEDRDRERKRVENDKQAQEDENKEELSKGIIDAFNDYLESIFSTYEEHDEEIEEELTAMYCLLWMILSGTLGIVAIIIVLTKYPHYLHTLHENQLWFSNIKEVEREISFRTEQGLYYSYYKQILEAPSWSEGLNELLHDNRTEHGRTINIIHRFNIFPEVILSGLYRLFAPQELPVMFYVSSVFYLHGIFAASLYITSWYLSGSFLSGLITVCLFVIHRIDTTRVNYTIPLRESFALPLLFLQMLLVCTFLKSSKWQKVKLAFILLLTMSFLLSWQFGPFVLLCHLLALTFLERLQFLSGSKVSALVLVMGAALLSCCAIQGNPPMVISSPAVSMIIPAFILTAAPPSKSSSAIIRLLVAAAELSLMLIITAIINGSIKVFLNIDSDSHIYQLLLAKLQLGDPRDFDSRLYMCSDAFHYMDVETVIRLSESGLLIIYAIGGFIWIISAIKLYLSKRHDFSYSEEEEELSQSSEAARENSLTLNNCDTESKNSYAAYYDGSDQCNDMNSSSKGKNMSPSTISGSGTLSADDTKKNNHRPVVETCEQESLLHNSPDVIYILTVSIIWGILAGLILRLKALWLPTVCVMSGMTIGSTKIYAAVCSSCRMVTSYLPRWFPVFLKIAAVLAFTTFLYQKFWDRVSSEIWPEEMYEFWDPDTVELMEWIQAHTPDSTVLAGSMQLLAGVKLCTGRHITNHPHFEDAWVRNRTHEIYRIYGRDSPEVVHAALRDAGATHIILEDSICLAPHDPKSPLCRLADIVDLHNGHIPESGGQNIPGLQQARHGRFCDLIRHNLPEYTKFFSLVMSNKTFRVYRVAIT